MAVINETAVTLRIWGDELQPEEISVALGCQPDTSASKGGTWRLPRGVERVSEIGMWHKRAARRAPGDLDEQVAELLAPMTDNVAVWQRLTTQFTADVFCGLFLNETNQGIGLDPPTLFALGARGLKLELDVYGLAIGTDADDAHTLSNGSPT